MAMQLILGTFDWKLSRRRRRIKSRQFAKRILLKVREYIQRGTSIFGNWSDGNSGHWFGYGGTRFGWAQVGYYCEALGFARVCKGLWWWWRRQKTYEMFGQHCGGVADAMYTIIKRGAGKEVAAIQQSGNRNASERFLDEGFMKSSKGNMLILRC
jgi:hypothetical protein